MLQQATSLDLAFQALADPVRRTMVERLSRGPATVSELARQLAMSLSAIGQHLRVLETSGLVRSAKVGRLRTCWIDPAGLLVTGRWIIARQASVERDLERLGEHLAAPTDPWRDP
ncbi:ArsR/SmtB family transcription factor [Phenylobacterium sp.]|uniref:ArsR/SmtB family transcription factor n=1 Tax=Phenylobacterium sp. TaxID=1871053 RepID=UPI002FC934CE